MSEKRRDKKGRILRTGESQRKDGLYEYKYTDTAGIRRTVYSWRLVSTDPFPSGRRKKESLREQEEKIKKDLEKGIDTVKSEMTLNELFELYMSLLNVAETTRVNYMSNWNREMKDSCLGKMKIKDIKPVDIDSLYSRFSAKGFKYSTIKVYNGLIYPALELAVDNDYIRKNPAKNCMRKIKNNSQEKKPLTSIEQKRLLDFVQQSNVYKKYYPMLVFFLGTGCRMGEAAGITLDDIDLDKKEIDINHQIVYKKLGDKTEFHARDLKTRAGRRKIIMTDFVKEAVLLQCEMNSYVELPYFEVDGYKDFLFVTKSGRPYAPNAFNAVLKNIVEACNRQELEKAADESAVLLPHISAHILRHTACTRMCDIGIDANVLRSIMGHADIKTTRKVYDHVLSERMEREIQKLDDFFRESQMS